VRFYSRSVDNLHIKCLLLSAFCPSSAARKASGKLMCHDLLCTILPTFGAVTCHCMQSVTTIRPKQINTTEIQNVNGGSRLNCISSQCQQCQIASLLETLRQDERRMTRHTTVCTSYRSVFVNACKRGWQPATCTRILCQRAVSVLPCHQRRRHRRHSYRCRLQFSATFSMF